jgi:SAM-dependent methyltransferase
MRRFYHGTTVHGIQFIDKARQREPLSYYHRTGPFGLAYAAFEPRPANNRVAAIGLGAGAMACYTSAGQEWTFYEIDPAVLSVAKNTNFFTYLEQSTNAVVEHKLGDARLRLREAPAEHYGLIICDAFSSDVPPLHLITKEAMELYLSKLAPGGRLVFNISSRYLDFRPVLGNLAASLQLSCVHYNEVAVSPAARKDGKYPSHWVVMSRQPQELGNLLTDSRWEVVKPSPEMRLWTDDYSNILAIFDWK